MSPFIEINRDALRHNFRQIQNLVGAQTRVIAVVKANAYGHGIVESARVFANEGAAMLAVTRVDEAIALRDGGIGAPILLLTPPLPHEESEAVAHHLTCCVSCIEDAQRLSKAAAAQNKTCRVQLKINSGMSRLGTEPENAAKLACEIVVLPNLKLEAVWTHFAQAGENDESSTRKAFAQFQSAAQQIESATSVAERHCANSAATLRFPEMRLGCVRPGTVLYGQFPSDEARDAAKKQGVVLRDGFRACARVVAIREVKRGQSVGYGGEWTARKTERIATIGIGYADGLTLSPDARTPNAARTLRNAFKNALRPQPRFAQWNNKRAPIIGRIAMQQTSILVTQLNDLKVGDVVTVSMRRLAAGAHLPRIYVDD